MGAAIPARIFGLRGEGVNGVTVEDGGVIRVECRRDVRYRPVDARTGPRGRVNRRVEALDFVEAGARYTKRLAERVSALCRHLPISAVAR